MEELHKKLQSHTVLIAEDDSTTLKWLVKVLSIYFKKVYGACDAMEALEIFNANPTTIVISDIQMPSVDGLSFLQKIMTLNPLTLRIVMTAFNSPIYINRAVQSEVNLYFKKPIDIDDLLLTIALNIDEVKNNVLNNSLGNGYVYNNLQKIVIKDKKNIRLTKKEILLTELLLKNRHRIVMMYEIEQSIWEEPTSLDAIRMVIVGLRKKLFPKFIENVKGLGYKLTI
jgi:DNA-binding response OmpR family regulator